MKCPKCGGFGKIYEHLICDRCNGTGEVSEQTNEAWFCSLPTEEKAKYIAKAMFFYDSQYKLTMIEALRKATKYKQGLNKTIENEVVEWLKEKHQ